MTTLYTYFRSSAAYRVRIAMNVKGLTYEPRFVHLVKDGGHQKKADYLALNPQGLVPALVDGPDVLTQSLAIIEYLDEAKPGPKLLPGDAIERAKIRAFSLAIACDIHPLNNLRVLNYLKGTYQADQGAVDQWVRTWVEMGLEALEAMLPTGAGPYCFGAQPTLADVCLVPQMFNARRFKCDLGRVPRLVAIDAHCLAQAPFKAAAPENQPDAE
ncbi:MAG: maleylacetoacetate isomerase [Pseudomonadota bacterium]